MGAAGGVTGTAATDTDTIRVTAVTAAGESATAAAIIDLTYAATTAFTYAVIGPSPPSSGHRCPRRQSTHRHTPVPYTHPRAPDTPDHLLCRLPLLHPHPPPYPPPPPPLSPQLNLYFSDQMGFWPFFSFFFFLIRAVPESRVV